MATKSKNDSPAVNAYLSSLPTGERGALESVRKLIKATVPGVDERIAYRVVMFSRGRDLVGFASQKKHLSFFIASPTLAGALKSHIMKTHEVSGATIHFSPAAPLPVQLVRKILQARVRENAGEPRRGMETTGSRRPRTKRSSAR